MTLEIVAGEQYRPLVRDWVFERVRDLRTPPERDYEAIGVANGKGVIGGVIYSHYHEIAEGEHDIMLTAAGEVGWLTRRTLSAILGYPFLQLRCVRLTSLVAKSNKASRNLVERLGFKLEGCMKHGRGIGKDCLIYGLIRDDADKWLK